MPGDDWVQVQNCNWLHEVLASAAIDDDRDPGA
jgi:hypothetical protein